MLESYLDEKRADQALRDLLDGLDASARESVERVVIELQPSANTLRAVVQLAEEIALRDNLALHQILGSPEADEIYDRKTSKKEKQRLLRKYLERRRYPQLAKIEENIQRCAAEILRDTGLRIELPRDLEGDTLSVTFSVKNATECERVSEQVASLGAHPATSKIFSLLRGEADEI